MAGLPYGSLLGLLGLVVNALLSFEEPHPGMLVASGLLTLAAPLGFSLHLALTNELTPSQKRAWMVGVVGRSGPALFAAYFRPVERRAATRWLARKP